MDQTLIVFQNSRRIFIDMLHLYGTRGEYQDLGENNFSVCEEVLKKPKKFSSLGGGWGGGGGKRQVYMPSRGMNA